MNEAIRADLLAQARHKSLRASQPIRLLVGKEHFIYERGKLVEYSDKGTYIPELDPRSNFYAGALQD